MIEGSSGFFIERDSCDSVGLASVDENDVLSEGAPVTVAGEAPVALRALHVAPGLPASRRVERAAGGERGAGRGRGGAPGAACQERSHYQ